MTWRNWGWHGRYRWFQLAMTIFIIVMMVVLYFDNETPEVVKVLVGIILLAAVILIYAAHPWITVTAGEVRLGYFPLVRITLPMHEIQTVALVRVRSMRDYGGFGTRGRASSDRGLLLGGYPPTGLKFETRDNRRYTITMRNIEPIVQELARYGCTLSAGNGDVIAEDA